MNAIGPAADSDLAAVVLSYRDQSGLVDAVRSLLAQDEPLEIVVVNSGGGTPAATLRNAGIDVRVVDRAEGLLVGAARNVGIDATRAPHVAFLAADCVAQAAWASGRLREHRTGARAVSAAIINPDEDNLPAWAAHIIDGARRMPGTPAEHRIDYSVSYERSLFVRFGPFREDVPVKEDTEFNARLAPFVPIRWAPDVRAAHRYPVTTRGLVRDQFARGRRDVQAIRRMDRRARNRKVAAGCLVRTRVHIEIALMSAQPQSVPTLRRAIPLALFAGVVRGLGALSA